MSGRGKLFPNAQLVWRRLPQLQVWLPPVPRNGTGTLRQLKVAVNDSRLTVLPEHLSIPQLAGVLTRCHLHLGQIPGSSLAMALGCPRSHFSASKKATNPGLHQAQITAPDVPSMPRPARRACQASGRTECFARIDPRGAGWFASNLGLERLVSPDKLLVRPFRRLHIASINDFVFGSKSGPGQALSRTALWDVDRSSPVFLDPW